MVLFGNKSDKDNERQVSREQAEQWCQENSKIPYFETSAVEKINVEDAFMCMVWRALDREKNNKAPITGPIMRDPTAKRIKLGKDDGKKKAPVTKPACDC